MVDKKISELTDYTPPIDADIIPIVDVTTSITKKLSWANIKATLKTYFDSLTTTLTNKTLTSPLFTGTIDGWISTGPFTYASATTITVAAGAVAIYKKGDKLRLTQTTVKYFYVTGVADTVLTITGGTSYTLANAAITLPFYSHVENPLGFPHWFSYTPTNTNITLGNGGQEAKFCLKGKTCQMTYYLILGPTTTFNGPVKIGLPITGVDSAYEYLFMGMGHYQDAGTKANNVFGPLLLIKNTATAYPITPSFDVIAAAVPFTWVATDVMRCNIAYEIV